MPQIQPDFRATRSIPGRYLFGLTTALGAASPACAHSPIPGIEGFYVGLLDPFLALPQALALLCLGLLASSFEGRRFLWFVGLFLVSTLGGLVLGAGFAQTAALLLFAAIVAGLWAGALPGRFPFVAFALLAFAGICLGAISIPDPGPMRARIVTASGSFVGLNVGFLYLAGGIQMAKERFSGSGIEIALRVVALVLGCAAAVVLAKSSDALVFLP